MSRVTTWARKLRLQSRRQKLVLMVLADHADVHTWTSIAGQELIAKETETSVRTVRTALAELEELGVIARRRRYRAHGYRTSDAVTLNRFWRPVDPDDDTNQASAVQDNAHPSPARTAGNQPPEDSYPEEGLTGNPRQAYRQRLPGYVSPEGSPENPSRTVDELLTSRAVFRRRDQRRRRQRPPRPQRTPIERRIWAACELLASRDLDNRRQARWLRDQDLGPVRHEWGWHSAAARRRLEHDGPELARLAHAHPDAPPWQLAHWLEPEPPPAPDLDPWATSVPAAVDDVWPGRKTIAAQGAAWHALRRAQEACA